MTIKRNLHDFTADELNAFVEFVHDSRVEPMIVQAGSLDEKQLEVYDRLDDEEVGSLFDSPMS